jgi:transposase-like protein
MSTTPNSEHFPHCPFADCDSHADPTTWRFIKKGFFLRDARPHRIQRYCCAHCHRSFSSQTFATTYWLKKPELLPLVFLRIGDGCSAFRQVARELGVAATTVQRQIERLGRHCLLFQLGRIQRLFAPSERVVLDGFHSFEFGQYWPFEINLLVGADSHFVYGFQDAELRRSGRMTDYQRNKRERLEDAFGRPDPAATRKSVQALLDRHLPIGSTTRLSTDEHKAYPRAISRLLGRVIEHDTTSSKQRRDKANPLYAVNLADLLIRHAGANHKRETIAFSKRRQGAMYRQAIWQVIRNFINPGSIKSHAVPPAVQVGAAKKRLAPRDVLFRRLFPWRFSLEGWLRQCYFGRIPTRRIGTIREHRAKFVV